jgi:hypothetical protein
VARSAGGSAMNIRVTTCFMRKFLRAGLQSGPGSPPERSPQGVCGPTGSEVRAKVLLPRGRGNSYLTMSAKVAVIRVELGMSPRFAARLRRAHKKHPKTAERGCGASSVSGVPAGARFARCGKEYWEESFDERRRIFTVRIRYSFSGGPPIGLGA